MLVIIVYDNLQGELKETKYYSKYKRINAKGIKEEAKQELIKNFGNYAKNYKISSLYREN